jgi:double zinc ribbon protein
MTWSVFGGIHSFFQSATWFAIQTLGLLFLILFWAATVYWVRKDAKRRITSRSLIRLVTLIGAVPPFLGPLVYMLFRPPEYLEDIRERELEIQAIKRGLGARECSVCHAEVDADFLVCPVCTTRLRQSCANCLRPLDSAWLVCPYCETLVETVAPVPWPTSTSSPPPPPRASRASRTSSRKAT